MNFTEVVAQVLDVVKRPDKITTIRREVNSAIAIFAQDGDWNRCFTEALVAINPASYTQAVVMTEFVRHRKFKYIRRAGTNQYLKKLDFDNLAKSNCDMSDKYYIAGTNLNISMVSYAQNLDVGYFQYPPVLTDAAPDYWLLEGAWPAVFNRATGKVLNDIGDATNASIYERHAVAAWLGFRNDSHLQE